MSIDTTDSGATCSAQKKAPADDAGGPAARVSRPVAGMESRADHAVPADEGHGATEPPRGRDRAALREGFTTGTAMTAGAVAALRHVFGLPFLPVLSVPLPPQEGVGVPGRLGVPVAEVLTEGDGATGVVIKDGGDDPDATHGARIETHVRLLPDATATLLLEGGTGVGRVTLPGLPVAVGEVAVNPGPRAQLEFAVREVCAAQGYGGGVRVTVRVPEGEAIARHTLNGRLGIVGGISILGTRGTVRPYSHEAWKAAIAQELSVARALGHRRACLSTGRRSETHATLPRPA